MITGFILFGCIMLISGAFVGAMWVLNGGFERGRVIDLWLCDGTKLITSVDSEGRVLNIIEEQQSTEEAKLRTAQK